jgi:hypothetical protein
MTISSAGNNLVIQKRFVYHVQCTVDHFLIKNTILYVNCIQGPSWSQSAPITTNVVSSNPVHSKVYSIQHYVIKFVSDLRQVGGFLQILRFLPRYNWNIVENGIKYHKPKAKLILTTYLWVFDKERLWRGPM